MDSLGDIVQSKNFQEPPEVARIKEYVQSAHNAKCTVSMQQNSIIIGVSSGALAGNLRMSLPQLQAASGSSKRLIIRIQR